MRKKTEFFWAKFLYFGYFSDVKQTVKIQNTIPTTTTKKVKGMK